MDDNPRVNPDVCEINAAANVQFGQLIFTAPEFPQRRNGGQLQLGHRRRADMLRVYGPNRPTSGVCATAGAPQGEKSLSRRQFQSILTPVGTPLGECRRRNVSRLR